MSRLRDLTDLQSELAAEQEERFTQTYERCIAMARWLEHGVPPWKWTSLPGYARAGRKWFTWSRWADGTLIWFAWPLTSEPRAWLVSERRP